MRILRRDEVTKKIGLERSAIYERVRAGTMPAPIRLGPKAVGWLESELDAWLVTLVAERDVSPQPKKKRPR